MVQAFFALALLGVMWLVGKIPNHVGLFEPAKISLGYGFLLLEAYLLGDLAARWKLPKLSGYILVGILCGPFGFGFIGQELSGKMRLIDDLALTFIALTAGAELHLSVLQARRRTIGWVIVTGTVMAAVGIGLSVWLLRGLFPFARAASATDVWVIGALFGVIAVARSPTSAIAIISECEAKGPFTDTAFGVTVAVDCLVILLFAVTVSFGEAAVFEGRGIDVVFIGTVVAQVVVSVGAGVLIGRGVSFYIERIKKDLTVFLVVLSFLITYTSRWVSHTLETHVGVGFHLEPLLIATAAGFVVQNFARGGERLVGALHAISLPIFVVFFSMAGVTLDLGALAGTWGLALVLVALRMGLTSVSSYAGCALAGESRQFRRLCGLTFYTQAGVSLGLAHVLSQRFPTWGADAEAFLVACIALNQIAGPVAFKFALDRMGESGKASPDAALEQG